MDEPNQIIARIPGWTEAGDLQIERIAGLTNTNYRVTVNGERYVLRVSGQNASRLGIDRQHELAALQSASTAGIGPEVVHFIWPEGHLVTRWVEGKHWEPVEFRTPEQVRLMVETVRRVHALPSNGATFSPFRRVGAYLETARTFGAPLPSEMADYLETMQRIERDQSADPSDWLHFCHNDLVSVNYLYSEQVQRITILDWEFAGLGDIYYDLATLVYTHDSEGPIPPDLEEYLLECYLGVVSPANRRRLAGMKFMLMLFTAGWGFAQHGMLQAGLIPPAEGFDYLEFARYLCKHDLQELRDAYRN
jgi:thiamine kinase-like enzyme